MNLQCTSYSLQTSPGATFGTPVECGLRVATEGQTQSIIISILPGSKSSCSTPAQTGHSMVQKCPKCVREKVEQNCCYSVNSQSALLHGSIPSETSPKALNNCLAGFSLLTRATVQELLEKKNPSFHSNH